MQLKERLIQEITKLETALADAQKREREVVASLSKERLAFSKLHTQYSLGRLPESGLDSARRNLAIGVEKESAIRQEIQQCTNSLHSHRRELARLEAMPAAYRM